jgi:hypothetical protein
VTHGPRCIERWKWERAFSFERVKHDYLMLSDANNDDRVNVFDAINRAEINENDGMMTVNKLAHTSSEFPAYGTGASMASRFSS